VKFNTNLIRRSRRNRRALLRPVIGEGALDTSACRIAVLANALPIGSGVVVSQSNSGNGQRLLMPAGFWRSRGLYLLLIETTCARERRLHENVALHNLRTLVS